MSKNNKESNLCKDKGQHNLRSLMVEEHLLKCVKCKKVFIIVKEQAGKIRIEEVEIK